MPHQGWTSLTQGSPSQGPAVSWTWPWAHFSGKDKNRPAGPRPCGTPCSPGRSGPRVGWGVTGGGLRQAFSPHQEAPPAPPGPARSWEALTAGFHARGRSGSFRVTCFPARPSVARGTPLGAWGRAMTATRETGLVRPTDRPSLLRPTIGRGFPAAPGGPRAPTAPPRKAPGPRPSGSRPDSRHVRGRAGPVRGGTCAGRGRESLATFLALLRTWTPRVALLQAHAPSRLHPLSPLPVERTRVPTRRAGPAPRSRNFRWRIAGPGPSGSGARAAGSGCGRRAGQTRSLGAKPRLCRAAP